MIFGTGRVKNPALSFLSINYMPECNKKTGSSYGTYSTH